jgi:hypothetical protein
MALGCRMNKAYELMVWGLGLRAEKLSYRVR